MYAISSLAPQDLFNKERDKPRRLHLKNRGKIILPPEHNSTLHLTMQVLNAKCSFLLLTLLTLVGGIHFQIYQSG